MQIFAVHKDPRKAAARLCDVHVRKMIVETAQLLSAAWHTCGRQIPESLRPALYRKTHANHPCTRWVRQNASHYRWLATHGLALVDTYNRRRLRKIDGGEHATAWRLRALSKHVPATASGGAKPAEFARALPATAATAAAAACVGQWPENTIKAYRLFYRYKRDVSKMRMQWSAPDQTPRWMAGRYRPGRILLK